eukprot:c8280_g2_i1 orf=1-351(-)
MAAEDISGNLTRKRLREELQTDDCIYEAFSGGEREAPDHHLHQTEAEHTGSNLSGLCHLSGLGFVSDTVKLLRLDLEEGLHDSSPILVSQCDCNAGSIVEALAVPSDGGGVPSGSRS